jgi:hypothetical protein
MTNLSEFAIENFCDPSHRTIRTMQMKLPTGLYYAHGSYGTKRVEEN